MEEVYYDTYCVKCGHVIHTDALSFDFRRALKQYSEMLDSAFGELGQEDEEDSWREEWEMLLEDMRIPILLNVTTLQKKYQLFEKETPDGEELQLSMEDIRGCIGACVEMEDWSLAQSQMVYKRLVLRYGREAILYETWQRLCRVMEEHPLEIVLQGAVVRTIAKNDQGARYTAGLRLLFEDHSFVNMDTAACEHCGNPLMEKAGLHEEIVIGMIGSGRVGKTAYLAALIHCLQKGNAIGASMAGTSSSFDRMVLNPYRRGVRIPKTELTGSEIPLFSHSIRVGPKAYTFTFVDMPGEAFVMDEEEQGREQARDVVMKRQVLKNARAFWFCLDPTQIERDLSVFRQDRRDDRVIDDLSQVITGSLKTYRLIHPEYTRLPAAVMVTKCDQLSDLGIFLPEEEENNEVELRYLFGNDEQAALQRDLSQDTPEFWVEANTYDTHPFRVKYVERHARQLTHELSPYFKINYFPVAAYGHEVDHEFPLLPEPSGVRLPFYWTLAALGLIRPVKEVIMTRTLKRGILRRTAETREEFVKVDADPDELYCNP